MLEKERTIQTLFDEAIQFDEPYTAHYIYFAVLKGKVTMQDKAEKLFNLSFTKSEMEDFRLLRDSDTLNMRPIKIFAIQNNTNTYAFYFAKCLGDARKLHHQLYGVWENKITIAYNQMIDKSIYFPHSNETKTFRQLLKETVVFPRWVCEMEGMIQIK